MTPAQRIIRRIEEQINEGNRLITRIEEGGGPNSKANASFMGGLRDALGGLGGVMGTLSSAAKDHVISGTLFATILKFERQFVAIINLLLSLGVITSLPTKLRKSLKVFGTAATLGYVATGGGRNRRNTVYGDGGTGYGASYAGKRGGGPLPGVGRRFNAAGQPVRGPDRTPRRTRSDAGLPIF